MRFIGDFWHKIELPYIYSLANSKIPIRFGMVDDELGSIRFWPLTKRPVKRSEVKFGGNFFHALYHTMFCRLFLISRPVVATGRKNGCAQICSLQICKCWGVLKYMAKMVNATIAYQKWLGKRGIYHVCHIFAPQYLHVCNVFARSKFVQIHFFCPVLEFADGWKTAINCHEFAAK